MKTKNQKMRSKDPSEDSFRIKKVGTTVRHSKRLSIYDEFDMDDDYLDEIPADFDDLVMDDDDDDYYDEEEDSDYLDNNY